MPLKKYKSLRLKDYDYTLPGAYFITICVKDRKCLFGNVSGGVMILNAAGKIVQNEMINIATHYQNIEVGENIVMPNHVHMVVYIYELTGVRQVVTPTKRIRLQDVVGSYKSGASREIRKIKGCENFRWQRYYHDHIIRNDKALVNISQYIRLNPVNWAEDIENELYVMGITQKERTDKAKKFYKNLTA